MGQRHTGHCRRAGKFYLCIRARNPRLLSPLSVVYAVLNSLPEMTPEDIINELERIVKLWTTGSQ